MITKKPHQQLIHPQSLETIGATNKNVNITDDNNLPLHPQSLETINTKKVCLMENLNTVTLYKYFLISVIYYSFYKGFTSEYLNKESITIITISQLWI